MKEIMQMIVVLSVICTACGLALSGIRNMTAVRIENQVLMNVQGPKVKLVLDGAENDLIADRKKITIKGEEILLFVGKKAGKDWAIAYETVGKGFGGDLTIMVGYDLALNKLTGIQVISHKETPGVGSRVSEDQFTKRFKGLDVASKFAPKNEGGDIDAISGATWSSKGVLEAVRKSVALYPEIKKTGP
jgi:electron transport complex protein RnfG